MTVEVFGCAVDVLFFLLELRKCLLENPLFHARPMLTRYTGLLSELWTAQHVFRGPERSTEYVDTPLFVSFRKQQWSFLQIDVMLRFGEVFIWFGSRSCRLVHDGLALFPFELLIKAEKKSRLDVQQKSDYWRAQRKKVRPHSGTVVLQVALPSSEKQRVIWILALRNPAKSFHRKPKTKTARSVLSFSQNSKRTQVI